VMLFRESARVTIHPVAAPSMISSWIFAAVEISVFSLFVICACDFAVFSLFSTSTIFWNEAFYCNILNMISDRFDDSACRFRGAKMSLKFHSAGLGAARFGILDPR